MKNIIFLSTAAMIMSSPVVMSNCFRKKDTRHYDIQVVVKKIDGNTVTCIDRDGNMWDFTSRSGDGYEVGVLLDLAMDNMNTKYNVYDDEIIRVCKTSQQRAFKASLRDVYKKGYKYTYHG